MKPLRDIRPGKRVHAFQGPNMHRWGTIVGQGSTRTRLRIAWDPEPQPQPTTSNEQPTLDKLF